MDVYEVSERVAHILESARKEGAEILETGPTHARFIPPGANVFVTVEYYDLGQGPVVWSYGRVGDEREISSHQRFYGRPEDFLGDLISTIGGGFPLVRMSLLDD